MIVILIEHNAVFIDIFVVSPKFSVKVNVVSVGVVVGGTIATCVALRTKASFVSQAMHMK